MDDPRLPLTVTVLLLGAAALVLSAVGADLAALDRAAWLGSAAGFAALAVLAARSRLIPPTAITVALVIGLALFLRRVWIAPTDAPADLVSLQYLSFRGVTLLSGAAFIGLGPSRGLVVSGVNLLTAVVVLVAGPMGLDHPAGVVETVLPVAVQAGIVILMFRILAASVESQRERAQTAQERAELAFRDELTDLPNRRQMSVHLRAAVARAHEGGGPDTVVMFDLDHCKAVNDTLGHDVGDEVLRQTAVVVAGTVRERDVLARWGGEEFVALLVDTDLGEGSEVAERCRLALEAMGGRVPLTASFGVTAVEPGDTVTDLLRRVDLALYEAKQSGRNRVVLVGAA